MAGGDSKNVGVLPLRTDFCTCCVYWSRIVICSMCLPQYVDFGLPPAQACVCLWCQDCTLVVGYGSNCCVVL